MSARLTDKRLDELPPELRVAAAAQEQRVPTPAQGATIGRLVVDFRPSEVSITYEPFDLPTGYVLVQLRPGGFTAGIAPDGRASS